MSSNTVVSNCENRSMQTQKRRLFCLIVVAMSLPLLFRVEARCQSVLPGSGDLLPSPVVPQTLQPFSQVPLSVPAFGWLRTAQCDDSGTMFFATTAGPPRSGVTYLSISADGQKQTVYHPPDDVNENPWNTVFSVSPDGRLHLLLVIPGQQPIEWLTFEKDGKLDTVVTLAAPSDIDVRSFSTTAQGYLLLVGYYPLTKTHGKNEGETYTAIFNFKGELVAKLTPEDAGMQANGKFAGSPEEPAAVEGEQFFWTSSSGKSLVVTATDGTTVRRLPLPAARPGDQVMGLRISGGQALITYVNFKTDPRTRYLLLNAATGDRYGVYLPPTGIRGSAACFDSSRGFTFLLPSGGHLSLVRSLLP